MEFAFTKSARKNKAKYEPTSVRQWIHHMLSEFFGTIWLSLGLAGLAAILPNGNVAEHYFLNPVFVGLYAGFIVVGTCLLFFLRWSCDLNPAVTTYRMITGANTYRYSFAKIAVQMVAATIAGLMLYGMAKGNYLEKNTTSYEAVVPFNGFDMLGKSSFPGKLTINNGTAFMWVFFGEMLITSILLWPIFTKSIKDKYRDLIICFIIAFDVMGAICFGTAAINPARGFTQQVPTLFFSHVKLSEVVVSTIALMLGGFAAPFFLVAMQELTAKLINPLYTKGIKWKNVHHT
ncbi:aquaporin, partial [Mycoplasma marinum]